MVRCLTRRRWRPIAPRAGTFARAGLLLVLLLGAAVGGAPPAPAPLEPHVDAVLDNGRGDRDDDVEWRFTWTPVAEAGGYHLRVLAPGGDRAAVDVVTTEPAHLALWPGAYVADGDRAGWTWTVRARVGAAWGPWSPPRAFEVEPVDTDPPRRATPPAACPALRAPAVDAVLLAPGEGGAVAWRFEWTGCVGADAYALVVRCDGAGAAWFAREVAATAFVVVHCGTELGGRACDWRVRARVDGAWGGWSEVRRFEVAPAAPGTAPDGPSACAPTD